MAQEKHRAGGRKRSHKRHPVFIDLRHRRARLLKILAALTGFVFLSWATTLALGVYYIDILPENEKLELIRQGSLSADRPFDDHSDPTQTVCSGAPIGAMDVVPSAAAMPTAAYLRVWPDGSLVTLKRNCGGLDGVLAEWLSIDTASQTVEWLSETGRDGALRDLRRYQPALGIELVALLPLTPLRSGRAALLDGSEARARIIAALTSKIGDGGYSGICLYPYQVEQGHLAGLRALLTELKAALPAGLRECLVVNAEGPLWRDAGLIDAVDSVVLRAFAEPDAGAPPGPLAPQGWFETLLEDATAAVGSAKLRLALGSFGYMWIEGEAEPLNLSFAEAMRLAARHKSTIAMDETSLNTHITFPKDDGRKAEIWLLDAASLQNQLRSLARTRLAGTVLWSAGLEDPAAWSLVARGGEQLRAGALETVEFPDVVGYEGIGPFRRVVQSAAAGARRFFRDPATGYITGEIYDVIPRPFTVERYGGQDGKVVALTFDDGPDSTYTTEILDVLKRNNVPATFFVIGSNMVKYPDVVRRMVEEGHEVGSHTFFHPEDDEMGPERSRLELNAFQRLLASVTGRTTYLFRTPYGRSEGPATQSEAATLLAYENEGYLVVGADIVPRDWEGMTAVEIADYVLAQMGNDGSQVIVMHDAGGDRSATADAVPILIDRLRALDYRFVPLSNFLGLSRDQVMPIGTDRLTPLDHASFIAIAALGRALVWIFWGAVVYGIVRSLFVLSVAFLRRRHPGSLTEPPKDVVVAIPAYNEELVIVDGIAAALASDYPNVRVIVIDDGSTDGTAAAVMRAFGDDARVRLIRQENGGKWSALNAAYGEIESEVVVALDADTLLHPKAVRMLLGHFEDPRVGAVAGNVKVGNRHGLLPRLQALEYITAQNIDRRAAERLNAILVVPGSIGAWRTEAVRKVGLYSPDTITEDADLTVAILRAGYRVVFEERAFSITDAPETIRSFMKQRLRWTFGMMQTSWKHRRAAKTARGVGLFSIPDLWMTGVVLGLMAPLADAVFAGVLLKTALNLALGQPLSNGDTSLVMIAGWMTLPLLDLIVALTAFGFERHEKLSLVLSIPFQRLIYRPLLYVTIYRAVGHVLAGHIAGWGKLIRRGGVEKPAR